jgi:hypothetical protein
MSRNENKMLTETDAKSILFDRPLVFGDAEQIKAKKFLDALAEAVAAFENCKHYDPAACDCMGELLDDPEVSTAMVQRYRKNPRKLERLSDTMGLEVEDIL